MRMTKVELFAAIRRDARVEGAVAAGAGHKVRGASPDGG